MNCNFYSLQQTVKTTKKPRVGLTSASLVVFWWFFGGFKTSRWVAGIKTVGNRACFGSIFGGFLTGEPLLGRGFDVENLTFS